MANKTEDRIKQYRAHAADALASAAKVAPVQAPLFIRLAKQWTMMAEMLERGLMN